MALHPNEKAIRDFYAAFARRDAQAMALFYGPDAVFGDPVFPYLRGNDIVAMWSMLASGARDLQVELLDAQATETSGSASWTATYTFSGTGRRVVNVVEARFRFVRGRVVEHADSFDFWRWSRMALGAPGLLFGWTPIIKAKVRKMAARRLQAWKETPRATLPPLAALK